MTKAKKTAKKNCTCTAKANEQLAADNSCIECSISMMNPAQTGLPIIRFIKVDPKIRRGGSGFMMPNFCPFCGKKFAS